MAESSISQAGSSNSVCSMEVSIASGRKRHAPEGGYRSKFINAAKRVAQGISKSFKPTSHTSSATQQVGQGRRTASSSAPHTTRTVKFPSTAASSIRQAFPYQVSHTYSAGVQACQSDQLPRGQACQIKLFNKYLDVLALIVCKTQSQRVAFSHLQRDPTFLRL